MNPSPAESMIADFLRIEINNNLETIRIAMTIPTCIPIHIKNGVLLNMDNNSCKLCDGSSNAPNPAIKPAPTLTSNVPAKLNLVNPSPSNRLARIALKMSPLACNGASMTSGRVVIWTLEPRILETRKIVRPSLQSPLRNGRRLWWRGLDSSLTWDFRCNVSPRDWMREVIIAVVTPRVIGPADRGMASMLARGERWTSMIELQLLKD